MTTTALDRTPHGHPPGPHPDHPAAWVGDARIEVADVDTEVTRLRAGPRAALLPVAESSEGRQLRRWVTQTLVARALLEQEARLRDLVDEPLSVAIVPDRMAAATFGGVVTTVLRSSGSARAVYLDVTRGVTVTADETAAYLERSAPTTDREPVGASDSELAGARSRLTAARARQVFLDWLSRRTDELVRLEAGHEHPGDPHQPDATHRH